VGEAWKKGTFLIDWWSCAEAVVLDTAGGIVFREDQGYDSAEWQSLLTLLKKHRPQCPINGALVMLPAQLLWLKDDELPEGWMNLDQYAKKLRVQIRKKLQEDLGIRFPIYFVVTQTDRVPGFREFADALEANGKSKGQMIGWSLPVKIGRDSLKPAEGGASDPELAEIKLLYQRLRDVAGDLRRERLALLAKYTGDGARADQMGMEVRRQAAELFAFPDAVEHTLAPRLKELLEKVFKPDPTLPHMPPYLRGVYFTSALREGVVLDRRHTDVGRTLAALALPGGADNEQPRPFFLKDLIFEKAFAEWGLVTPIVRASAYLRQRQRAVILSGIAAGLVLSVAVGIGGCSYYHAVDQELKQWEQAKTAATNELTRSMNRYWLPVLTNENNSVRVLPDNLTNQIALAKSAAAGLQSPSFWSFRWLFGMRGLDEQRRKAQLGIFEHGVIWPLVDLARAKLLDSTNQDPPADPAQLARESQQFEGGLLGMLEVELHTNHFGKDYNWGASRDRVMDGLGNYVLAALKDEARADTLAKLKALCESTYQGRQERWPPARVRQQESLSNLVETAFLRVGQLQIRQSDNFENRSKGLRTLVNDAWNLRNEEQALVADIDARESESVMKEKSERLRTDWNSLVAKLNTERMKLFQEGFTNFAKDKKQTADDNRQRLREQVSKVNGAVAGTNLIPMLAAGFDRLTNDTPQLEVILAGFRDQFPKAKQLDETVLAMYTPPARQGQSTGEPQPLLGQRLGVYDQILNLQVPSGLLRQYERQVFEEATSNPKDVMEGFGTATRQACGGFQFGSFSGLADDTEPYTNKLCQYIEFRFLEKFLERSERTTKDVLGASECEAELSSLRSPRTMLNDVGSVLSRLKKLDSIWVEMRTAWRRVCRKEHGATTRSVKAIEEKRTSTLDRVSSEIAEEKEQPKKFPLATQGDLMTEREVLNRRKRALDWQEALQNVSGEARLIDSEKRAEWAKVVSEDWLGRFDRLVDKSGDEMLDYEVRTPWEDQGIALKNFLHDDVAYERARHDAGVYKWWLINGQPLEADDLKSVVRVNATTAFTIEVRTDKNAPIETLKEIPRSDGWTIISMLDRDRRSKRPPYFAALPVVAGNGVTNVWFMIRPAPKNTR
jgi:hypothetical protein